MKNNSSNKSFFIFFLMIAILLLLGAMWGKEIVISILLHLVVFAIAIFCIGMLILMIATIEVKINEKNEKK